MKSPDRPLPKVIASGQEGRYIGRTLKAGPKGETETTRQGAEKGATQIIVELFAFRKSSKLSKSLLGKKNLKKKKGEE